jgi:hypothetical protein
MNAINPPLKFIDELHSLYAKRRWEIDELKKRNLKNLTYVFLARYIYAINIDTIQIGCGMNILRRNTS